MEKLAEFTLRFIRWRYSVTYNKPIVKRDPQTLSAYTCFTRIRMADGRSHAYVHWRTPVEIYSTVVGAVLCRFSLKWDESVRSQLDG
ncbi:hypothetical protein WUBG_12911 [Wuchereria bancrofti]|uniref:Uncharacterized protein n=1 Tax=Wuchereria bancrofti TaxID=6293 RepID=J9ELG7_WUCBA|nr:hypothetical protein WUBG_12911 [Wuchereria bancrofti]